jgi:hypothetical protein
MIPEVLVSDGLRAGRRYARQCAAQVGKETGCHMVAVIAEIAEGGRACTSMAVDPALDDQPEVEVTLMKCALARVLSLLVLHLGAREATACAMAALTQAAELARQAEDDAAGPG